MRHTERDARPGAEERVAFYKKMKPLEYAGFHGIYNELTVGKKTFAFTVKGEQKALEYAKRVGLPVEPTRS